MNIKNFRAYKRMLALLNAGIMAMTPVVASASENDTNTYNGLVLVQQEKFTTKMDSVQEFSNNVKNACEYLRQYINYDHLQEDVQCAYYLINHEHISYNLDDDLIGKAVYETTVDELTNFMNSFRLFNMIADYNQSTVRDGCKCGRTDIDTLIDVSKLCYDEHDEKLVHDMHVNYFNAYRNGRFPNEDYTKVFKQLTTLNACEQAGNAFELSTGAMWLAQQSIGNNVMQMLRDDMQEDYPRSELDKYFIKEELNRGQWFLRDDISLDLNCLSDLELEVFNFGELWHFCYDTVNIDLLTSFGIDLSGNTK